MANENLVTLEKIKEIINNLNPKDIVQYEGTVGSQINIIGSPLQSIELRIIYQGEQNDENRDKQ
jgi:hypothetical protein